MTLSALNAPESDVDIEGDSSSSKRLDFDSGKNFVYAKIIQFCFEKSSAVTCKIFKVPVSGKNRINYDTVVLYFRGLIMTCDILVLC